MSCLPTEQVLGTVSRWTATALATTRRCMEELTMDFIVGLPKSGGVGTIMVVVDCLSNYAHFVGLRHPFTAQVVVAVFVREVVRLHGVPKSIVSDRDNIFMSHFWTKLFHLQGAKLKHSTAYHPQTDGQMEVVNRGIETYLRYFTSDKPKDWYNWLPWAEFWYNSSYHSSS